MIMRVPHVYDSSFVLQYILHALEQSEIINVKELCIQFDYDESSIYKLLKKIKLNFAIIDSCYTVKKIEGGKYQLFTVSFTETEE